MGIRNYFRDAKLVRMSDGSYCIIRVLGRMKGGNGIRCHETLLRLTREGVTSKFVEMVQFAARFGVRDMSMPGSFER